MRGCLSSAFFARSSSEPSALVFSHVVRGKPLPALTAFLPTDFARAAKVLPAGFAVLMALLTTALGEPTFFVVMVFCAPREKGHPTSDEAQPATRPLPK